MSKEVINESIFQEQLLKKFKEKFKQNTWCFDGTDEERKDYLQNFLESENIDFSNTEFHKVFLTEYVSSFEKRENFKDFISDVTLATELTDKGVSFSSGALGEEVFDCLDKEYIKLLHHYFYITAVQKDLFNILLTSTREITESFKFNSDIEFDINFNLNAILEKIVGYISNKIEISDEETLKNGEYFQNYFLMNLKYRLEKTILDEEDLDIFEKTMNSFWYINFQNGCKMSSLYIQYLDFLKENENSYLKDTFLFLRKEHFQAYLVDEESWLNKPDFQEYVKAYWNSDSLIIDSEKKSIKVKENNLIIFDVNNLFSRDSSKNISNFFKRLKNIQSINIERIIDTDFLNINWDFSNEIKEGDSSNLSKFNDIVAGFLKEKLENIDQYSGNIEKVAEILKSECRELDLLLTLSQKEENKTKSVRLKI